ncbi:hypothetical protein J6590_082544 [Homalodisca vitripennis]|nr:hypothetical protein J6590_082544 [Homalodisca vitripennis]
METAKIIMESSADESKPMEVAEDFNKSIMQPDVEYSPSARLPQHLRALYPPEKLAYDWIQEYIRNKHNATKSLIDVILCSISIYDPQQSMCESIQNLTVDTFDGWLGVCREIDDLSFLKKDSLDTKIRNLEGNVQSLRNKIADLNNELKVKNALIGKLDEKRNDKLQDQGRELPEIVGKCSEEKISMDGLVTPDADVSSTNDMIKISPRFIHEEMENKLRTLSMSRSIFITTIPPRFDVPQNNSIHDDIAMVNNYIREIVVRMDRVHLIDLDAFRRFHFARQGLHLNYSGKKKLSYMIKEIKTLSWISTDLINLIHKRDKISKTLKRQPFNRELKKQYIDLRQHLTNSVKFAKRKYYRKKLNETKRDPKLFWGIINELAGRVNTKDSFPITKHLPGAIMISMLLKKVSNDFNKFFSAFGTNLATDIDTRGELVVRDSDYTKGMHFTLCTVSEQDVLRQVTALGKGLPRD